MIMYLVSKKDNIRKKNNFSIKENLKELIKVKIQIRNYG